MESQLVIPTISCSIHPNEPIIRVSLDLDDEKLLYCYDCLQLNKKSNLVKFQEVIQILMNQFSMQPMPVHASSSNETQDLINNIDEVQAEFSDKINQNKGQADTELKKIERAIIHLLQNIRADTHGKLDQYENCFNRLYNVYSIAAQTHEEILSSFDKETPTQSDLDQRIFDNESSQQAENNLRGVLKDLKALKEIKEGTALGRINKAKAKLEQICDSTFIIPEKSEKEYSSKLSILSSVFEAILSGAKLDANTETKDAQGKVQKETERQQQLSDDLIKTLEDLTKTMEVSNKKIEELLEEKFNIELPSPFCTVSKKGLTPVNGRAYRCSTCMTMYGELRQKDVICEGCKEVCHKNHQLTLLDVRDFICQCQFTMRDCKLAKECNFRYTGTKFIRQAYYICKTDRAGHASCVCSFCAQNCHKDHQVIYSGTGPAYCDCQSLYPFCKYHENKELKA